jgi:hypothetical protein
MKTTTRIYQSTVNIEETVRGVGKVPATYSTIIEKTVYQNGDTVLDYYEKRFQVVVNSYRVNAKSELGKKLLAMGGE